MLFKPAPSRKLSAHFSWAEVTAKSGYPAVPLGPFLLPNGKLVFPRKNARKHAKNLELLRARINNARLENGLRPTGIIVNSWARSWEHNKEVGGAIDSQHLYFLATDITFQEVKRLCPWAGGVEDFDLVAGRVFAAGGFGTYPAGDRHVDSRGTRARWSSWVGWK